MRLNIPSLLNLPCLWRASYLRANAPRAYSIGFALGFVLTSAQAPQALEAPQAMEAQQAMEAPQAVEAPQALAQAPASQSPNASRIESVIPQLLPPAQQISPQMRRIARLFERLRESEEPLEARAIAAEISKTMQNHNSETANLLLTRMMAAEQNGKREEAIDLLDHIIRLEPKWAEPYFLRAGIHAQQRDTDAALRDLQTSLQYEPRHFMALFQLGLIFERSGKLKPAAAAYEHVLALYPHMQGAKTRLEKLRPRLEGTKL